MSSSRYKWIDVKPGEGLLRAEGNGYSFNFTTSFRGLGPLAYFVHDESRTRKRDCWIPTKAVDTMAFESFLYTPIWEFLIP